MVIIARRVIRCKHFLYYSTPFLDRKLLFIFFKFVMLTMRWNVLVNLESRVKPILTCYIMCCSTLGYVMKSISRMPLLIDVVGSDGDLVCLVHTDPHNDWGSAVSCAKGLSINDLVEHKSPEANSMIWDRKVARSLAFDWPVSPVSGVDRVYIGHTVMEEVSNPAGSNIHLIDTGCWRANMGLWRDGGLACIDEVTIYNEIIL